jgi:GR25 family glycosyltransferase involved in LPS biosynthesis
MRSLIIHMPGDTKRAPNVQKLLGILPTPQVMDAVIGREVMDRVQMRGGDLHRPVYPFPLSAGEVGCFLSHRRCWQHILDEDLDYALIVEDDLAIDAEHWAQAMTLVTDNADADSFFRLPAKRREASARTIATHGEAKLFLPKVVGLQTVAQVVGKHAARRLLDASEVLDRPVDTFLQMHWIHGQQIHTILPNGVSEITSELGGSTIQKKSRPNNKLGREFKRAVYRAQVSTHPQKTLA